MATLVWAGGTLGEWPLVTTSTNWQHSTWTYTAKDWVDNEPVKQKPLTPIQRLNRDEFRRVAKQHMNWAARRNV